MNIIDRFVGMFFTSLGVLFTFNHLLFPEANLVQSVLLTIAGIPALILGIGILIGKAFKENEVKKHDDS